MSKSDLSRRDFLLRVGAVGALGVGAGTVLSACGGGESGTTSPRPSEPEAAAPMEAEAEAGCNDVTGLTAEEVGQRELLEYVDVSTDPEKPCSACALYVVPADGGACGGCTLLKGPIAPGGSCKSWAPKPTV